MKFNKAINSKVKGDLCLSKLATKTFRPYFSYNFVLKDKDASLWNDPSDFAPQEKKCSLFVNLFFKIKIKKT